MATILFVSGSYFPYATANAVCVKKFEDELRENGHRVIYCNRKHDLYEPDYHYYEGTELYTVGKNSDLFFQTFQQLGQLSLPNHMQGCFSLSCKAFRMFMKLRNFGKNSANLRDEASELYIEQYSDKIVSIIQLENVDLVMSVSMPFDSHKAVLKSMQKLKDKNSRQPKWIAYCIDAYWSKAGINQAEVPKKKVEEIAVFKACDMILLLETIANDFSSKEFDFCRSKIQQLPLPLFDLKFDKQYNEGISYTAVQPNYLFAGTIYDDYSNVDALAAIIRNLCDKPSIFHIMGKIYPKSLSILEELQEEYPEKLIIYGRQSYDYAKGSMLRADILVNLANDNSNQIPSKIFEYIACRKPIINIYRNPDDIGAKYLQKYPLAFNFNANKMVDMINELSEWLLFISSKTVSFEELRNIYKDILTETVTNKFYNLVKPYLSTVK